MSSRFFLRPAPLLLVLALGSALLPACSPNPASAGQAISDDYCTCATRKADLAYTDAVQLQHDLTTGKYPTRDDAVLALERLSEVIRHNDSLCMARVNARTTQVRYHEVKPADLPAFDQAVRDRYAQCQQALTAKRATHAPIDLNALIAKLPAGPAGPAPAGY